MNSVDLVIKRLSNANIFIICIKSYSSLMDRKISLLLSLITLSLTAQYSFSSPQLETVEGEKCFRNCHGAVPKICYFRFNLEYYHVLGP